MVCSIAVAFGDSIHEVRVYLLVADSDGSLGEDAVDCILRAYLWFVLWSALVR